MREEDLKPCPFCGGIDLLISGPVNDPPEDDFALSTWEVVCRNEQCKAVGPHVLDYDEAPEEARLLWNTRHGGGDGRGE